MNSPFMLEDWQWLILEGQHHLAAASRWFTQGDPVTTIIPRLRKDLPPNRASLVVQQISLRQRAAKKFSRAGQMFFTDLKLQQSTSEAIAVYKSRMYPTGNVADLCCGIGGDAVARAASLHVDLDPVCCLLATANLRVYGASDPKVVCQDVVDTDLSRIAAWHLDPDRRVRGHRTVRIEFGSPNLNTIEEMLQKQPNAAIKLAPACELPPRWRRNAKSEWIGQDGECKQLLACFGDLATGQAGERVATVVDDAANVLGQMTGQQDEVAGMASLDPFSKGDGRIYEPHATVRAAGLVNALAHQLALLRISADQSYLVGDDTELPHGKLRGLVSRFDILDTLPFDRKKVGKCLERMGFGHVEIKSKTRWVDAVKEQKDINRMLRSNAGGTMGTVFVVLIRRQMMAVIAKRGEA